MSYRNLLARATESTDAPTPGYLYVDLAKAATGNPNACQDMASYLTNRLASKNNPNVKFKCCKVISKLCDQVPRNYFRRCVAQDPNGITAIKEAMQYRGTMDPVRGDEPNERVRQAAKECLDAVYRESPMESQAATNFGSNAYNGNSATNSISNQYGAPPHASGAGKMQGIGNPRYQDPRLDPRYNNNEPQGFGSVVKEAGEVLVGMIKDPLARNIGPDVPKQGHSGNLPGYGGPSAYGRPPPGAAELSRRTDGQWTMASNRGPGAIQPDYQRDGAAPSSYGGSGIGASTGSVGGSWGSTPSGPSYSTPSVTITSAPGAPSGSGGGGIAISDGTYEKNLILELCPPGGLKPVPPPDKLANFARSCSSLNSDLVCPVLLDCLEEGQPWVIRAKALCTMETAIANGAKPDGTNSYRDFFFACRDEISPLSAHPRAPINEPARRVLSLLGVSANAIPTSSSAAAAPVAAAAPPPNLLDLDDDPTPVSVQNPPAPPTTAPPPPPPAASSMFGGMQVKSSPAPPQPLPPAAVPPAATTTNLLDFDAAPAAASTATTEVFQTSTIAMAPATTTDASTVATTSSMFDQLSVKDADSKQGNDITAVIGNGSSAFGFMNSADTAAASSVPPPAPTPHSFDPLKNNSLHAFSPNSAQKKMMEMSPEQIQAMAYQQMMMQQQLQMQMMMQQQMGGVVPMPGNMGTVGVGGGMPMYPPLGGGMPGVRRTPSMGSPNPSVGGGVVGGMPPTFSFAPKPAQKDDKKFDFVKDAMAGHKK